MPGAIHNYWLGIMALAFVLAMTLWICLVLWANKHPGGKVQESWPHRDVIGGAFSAREGGRQVTPDPRVPPESQMRVEAEQKEAEQKTAPRPPAPRESTETGAGAGQEAGVKTGRT
ncbi:MAG TPA: hypothetical protein VN695_14445 [Streptosporangiaceae bacterium]|nr:hypothetical protein [Streptosporangiaceae bacterium]